MVITITLNPCIDKTVGIDKFRYGGLNRVKPIRTDIAGKGINVSKVLRNLGFDTICMGFDFSESKSRLKSELEKLNIKSDLITIPREMRTNIKLCDSDNIITEINESGRSVRETDIKSLTAALETNLIRTDILVLSGSVPGGVSESIYADFIKIAKNAGVTTVLDAENRLLINGINACPDIIKPNIFELETAFGLKLFNKEEIVALSKKIIYNGVKIVCVSMGAEGAIIVSEKEAFYAPPLKIPVKGTVGAGDSMVAGICAAVLHNKSIEDVLKSAVSAAAGSLEKEGTVLCDSAGYNKFLAITEIVKI